MEFVELVHQLTPEGEETAIHLITKSDPEKCVEQEEALQKIQDSCSGSRVAVTFEYDESSTFHARSITADHGWKITLDRGLDIFQRFDNSPLNLAANIQEERLTKSSEVTYIKI